jgi:fibronectin-binding autotransporter adhesin
MASLAVTNTNASGTGSLAAAIASANGDNQANTITFSLPASSTPPKITLGGSALTLTNTTGIQAITAPPGGVTISGGGKSGVFVIDSSVTASFSGPTISNGSASEASSGGGLDNQGTATLTDCTIEGNVAGNGGGLYNDGTLNLTDCTISGNATTFSGVPAGPGGGVDNHGTAKLTACAIIGNRAISGAGLANYGGTLTMSDCTISGNVVPGGIGTGGGLVNSVTPYVAQASATLTNCTIVDNVAGTGGGLANYGGTLALTACTINGNVATDTDALGSVGGVLDDVTPATLTNTIVAGNTIAGSSTTSDIGGTVTGTYNLIGSGGAGGLTNGSHHNIVLSGSESPGLGPLEFYGGPTETIALLPGSPALGNGTASANDVTIPTTDQRGFALDSPAPDIGAFQFQSAVAVVNTTADGSGCPSGMTDLRGAVDLANVLPTQNPITFDSTVFATPQTIALTDGQLVLSNSSASEAIKGPAAGVTISGGGASGLFFVAANVIASFSGLTITGGNASGGFGGGLGNDGTVTLTDCAISGNSAKYGGGLENYGTMSLSDCTISGNGSPSGNGAGLDNQADATLTDCTISGNSAGQNGGGLRNLGASSTLTLNACTVTGNSAGVGGGFYLYAGQATLTDTIVAGNTGPSGADDISVHGTGATLSGTYDLIGSGGSGGLTNGTHHNIVLSGSESPGLSPLGYYGGPTQTVPLLPGSSAIGAGTGVAGATGDQRGFPISSPVDIGAFQTEYGLVVNTLSDGTSVPAGDMSLRDAVNLANVLTGSPQVTFDTTVFATPQTITLTDGQVVLSNTSSSETILGPAVGAIISGGGASGVFFVDTGVTGSFLGLTITDGAAGSSNSGGAFDNQGTATLTDCTISDSSAEFGGGLDNDGTATLTDCTIAGNSATGSHGGGVDNGSSATLDLTACTISGNSAAADGGGLNSFGTATLTDTIVAGNTITGSSTPADISGAVAGTYNLIGSGGSGELTSGGSKHNIVLSGSESPGLSPLGSYGGPTQTMDLEPGSEAIGDGTMASDVTLDQRGFPLSSPVDIGAFQTAHGLVVNTTSDGAGMPSGDMSLRDALSLANALTGRAPVTFDKTVFATPQTITLTHGLLLLRNTSGIEIITGPAAAVTISGGGASEVFSVASNVTATLSGLTIADGSLDTFSGGGLYNLGSTTLTDCTITGNSSVAGGGGVFNSGAGALTLNDCTISDNSAFYGGGLQDSGSGAVNLYDCTISGNMATGSHGGGIATDSSGTMILNECTISSNTSGAEGGGIANYYVAMTLTDTIVAGNTTTGGSTPDDIAGTVNVSGSSDNLIGSGGSGGLTNGINHNIVLSGSESAGLAPLAFYGGPTETIALLPGSVAKGAGAVQNSLTTDERGAPRPTSGGVDIGAFQDQGYTVATSSGSDQSGYVDQTFQDPLIAELTENFGGAPIPGVKLSFTTPGSGASARLTAGSAVTDQSGMASVSVTANATAGTYTVTASAAAVSAPASFSLVNQIQPSFSGLNSQTITYGTTLTLAGTLAAGGQIPVNEQVAVTVDGVTTKATVGSDGSFTTQFTPSNVALNASATAYTVSFSYRTDGVFLAAKGSSQVTVNPAPLLASLTGDPAKVFDGTAVAALTSANFELTGLISGQSFTVNQTSGTYNSADVTSASTVTASLSAGDFTPDAGTKASNYALPTEASGAGKITPAALLIAAVSTTIQAGSPVPAPTAVYTGFVSGDTPASLAQPPVLNSAAGGSPGPGVYPITVSGAGSMNYTITYEPGTLTVIPAPATVENVSIQKIKNGKHKAVSEIVVQFADALNAADAQDVSGYILTTVSKNKKHKSKPLALASATYNSSALTVTLVTKKPLVLSPPLNLTIESSAVLDALGRELDGNDSGEPGANFTAVVRKSGVSVISARARARPDGLSSGAVDSVLEVGLGAERSTGRPGAARASIQI